MSPEDALPAGTRVGDFEIRRVIGWGGAGIVYEAYDPGLDRVIALNELFLAGHARRNGLEVEPAKPSSVTVCDAGKARFLREARLLAMLHERASGTASLVIVHRVLQQNRTAYMAMKLYSGDTLRTVITRDPTRVTQSWLISLLLKLLDALEALHTVPGEELVHRDVSPDNIILQPDGVPVLLDFGATRSTKGEITAMIFKPGFSPIEQYTDNYPQGPWTDIYALCGVAYYAICGQAPDEAAARLAGKAMVPAVERGKGRFAQEFLAVIDHGLNLLPWDRYTDVPAMRTALRALPHFEDVALITAAATAPLLNDSAWQTTQHQPSRQRSEDTIPTVQVSERDIPTVQQPLPSSYGATSGFGPLLDRPLTQERPARAAAAPVPAKTHTRTWLMAGLALLVVGATFWGLRSWQASSGSAAVAPAVALKAEPAASAVTMPTPPVVVAPQVVTPTPAKVALPGLDCAEADASWRCVVAGLARVAPATGSLDFSISPSVARPGESLQVQVSAATGGYLYLYSIDDHAGARAELLFPNARDRNNQMLPGVTAQLPRPHWQLELQPPVGRVWIVAVITREPLSLQAGSAERPLLPAAVQAFVQRTPMSTLGWPACRAGSAGCPEALAVSTTEMTIR